MSAFIPLRLYSEYSIDNSIVRLKDAVERAKAEGLPALALCDSMNMFGAIKFYQLCRDAGIKPILGVDCAVENPEDVNHPHHLTLLAKNNAGYRILCELLTRAYLDESHPLAPTAIKKEWLKDYDLSSLICLSGGSRGEIGDLLARGKKERAVDAATRLASLFPGNFYLEIGRLFAVPETANTADDKALLELQNREALVLEGGVKLAKELKLPLVATHPVQFMNPEDYFAHEAKVCITSGRVLADPKRPRAYHPAEYFLSGEKMAELFADLPAALENSGEIAKRCTVTLELGKNYLPLFPTPAGKSLDDYLADSAALGLDARLKVNFPDETEREKVLDAYRERLSFELDIITKMGFAGYFLIVADFINWAKNNGCPVGPGRGSGAGSLVAYSLKITELDPLRYHLLFERFLNPERVSMPDFDVDFCQENRGRVIDYVRHKYGELAVSQIVTFGTMSSKAVVRDVGRVLGVPFGICDRLSKLIPVEANRPVSLKRALELEPEIKRIIKAEEAESLLALSLKLEDLVRNTGMHAGGVLIAPGKLTDFCAVYKAKGEDSATLSMYDKEDVERVGLVKFDFLGLRNLTTIKMALDLIEKTQGKKIDIAAIPLDDPATFAIFARGNTGAVFQFESAGMKRMLLDAKPAKFDEIIAFVALYRPGPMDLIPDFIHRMQGEKFTAIHPLLEPILSPTYGIMVYQEQVMQAAQICAGYTLGEADLLRRAMSKKKVEEMARQRANFLEGAAKNGIDAAKANEIFDYIERFAGYGFNKSHAAAYALIAYQTAWLKAHYPVEFMSATMSGEFNDTDQVEVFVHDAEKNGIRFLPPDINYSDYYFIPEGEKTIRYALGAIKGVGEPVAVKIAAARSEGGPFQDLFDFCLRLDKNVANKRVLESLIKAGAFDTLNPKRGELFANIGLAMSYAEQKNQEKGQGGLFDSHEELAHYVKLKEAPDWSLAHRLGAEKEALGFYFSAHPFAPYQETFTHLPHTELKSLAPHDFVRVGGFVRKVRTIPTKTGGRLWIVELDDASAKAEIVVPEEVIYTSGLTPAADTAIMAECAVKDDRFKGGLRITAKRLLTWERAQAEFARSLTLRLGKEANVKKLKKLLEPHHAAGSAGLPLKLIYADSEITGEMTASAAWEVIPTAELLGDLRRLLGADNAELVWH